MTTGSGVQREFLYQNDSILVNRGPGRGHNCFSCGIGNSMYPLLYISRIDHDDALQILKQSSVLICWLIVFTYFNTDCSGQ